jgi:ribosomal-protein-alanine N-acetyltransferase
VARPGDVRELLGGVPPVSHVATDRLVVRPTLARDLAAIESFWQDPQANRLDHGTPDPGAWQRANVVRLRHLLRKRPSHTMWTLLHLPALEVIGYVRLRRHSLVEGHATMGVRLGRTWWGKGYAAEALKALCAHLAAAKKLQLLELEVLAENTRALRAYGKAGFSLAWRRQRKGRLWCGLEWHAGT